MTGIGLLIFILIWGSVSIGLGKLLSRKVLTRYTTDLTTLKSTIRGDLITFFLSALIFLLPIADEIISYPSYYKMCEDAGKYQFAPGMDEKKVFGRDYRIEVEDEKLIRLFPSFQELQPTQDKNFGVVVKVNKLKLTDENTKETLLTTQIVKPLRSFFAIPWDGKRIPWLLHECSDMVGKNGEASQNFIRSLRLHLIYHLD